MKGCEATEINTGASSDSKFTRGFLFHVIFPKTKARKLGVKCSVQIQLAPSLTPHVLSIVLSHEHVEMHGSEKTSSAEALPALKK